MFGRRAVGLLTPAVTLNVVAVVYAAAVTVSFGENYPIRADRFPPRPSVSM